MRSAAAGRRGTHEHALLRMPLLLSLLPTLPPCAGSVAAAAAATHDQLQTQAAAPAAPAGEGQCQPGGMAVACRDAQSAGVGDCLVCLLQRPEFAACSDRSIDHFCHQAAAPPGPVPQASGWAHSWATAGAAWWGDFGYSLLTEPQAKFIAENYYLASLEKCTGRGEGLPTEEGIYQTARQLKKYNPSLKTTFYWHTGQAGIGCYAANKTFHAHPEWWLRDDNGNVVGHKDSTHPSGQPRIDWTNTAAADWWVSVPLAGAGADQLIDGVLADGAGYEKIPNITVARLQKLYTAKLAMLANLQAAFDKAGRGGVVFGNGLSEYDQSPTDPHSRRILTATRGIQNEHFAAFEQVDPATGALRKDKVADVLANIEWAAAQKNADGSPKQVVCPRPSRLQNVRCLRWGQARPRDPRVV